MLMIRPQPRSRIPGKVALAMLKHPPRLMRITSFQSSNDIRCSVPSRVMPALLTTTSTGPMSASTCAHPARQASWSPTSHLYDAIPVSAVNSAALALLPP